MGTDLECVSKKAEISKKSHGQVPFSRICFIGASEYKIGMEEVSYSIYGW